MSLPGRVLAVDYGLCRTGLAVCDPLGIAAHPVAAVVSEDLERTIDGILAEVDEREVRIVLIGMPFLPSGDEGAQVQNVRLFMSALRERLPAGVEMEEWDERHTTSQARELLRDAGFNRRDSKPLLDSTAAVVLLRDWLANRESRSG